MARVDRLYEEADEHAHLSGDTDLQQQLLAQVGALYNTRSLVRLTAQPWWADDDTDTEPPAGDEEPGTVAVTDRTADDVLSWFRRRREARRDGIRPAPDPSPTDQVPSPVVPLEGLAVGTHPGPRTAPAAPERSRTCGPRPARAEVSDPPTPDRSHTPAPDPSRSNEQVPDQTSPADLDPKTSKTRTGPRRSRKKADPLDRLDEAIATDKAYLADHGRHIPAEKLARALSIGKPAALELTRHVRRGPIEIAE
ncbi:hypothetical protein LUX57_01780 [Actinomadura madurae]|nr:hypothetical protein [Actinomadura madurae]MCP9964080.1 hypothetical protein [Actinomadura madurae]